MTTTQTSRDERVGRYALKLTTELPRKRLYYKCLTKGTLREHPREIRGQPHNGFELYDPYLRRPQSPRNQVDWEDRGFQERLLERKNGDGHHGDPAVEDLGLA